ncbi:MAG: ATP-binding cassette domain-containing protein [Myxococcales bacterium]|nr:ATP-binding cassette domain-containing protein [Myxococcales bacterium]
MITANELSRSFADVDAVSGISFHVEPGTIYGLLGPNGAGKTTALRILATLLRPTGGQATVAGFDVVENPVEVRRNLGYLTGDTGLYQRLTPVEILRYFGNLHGMAPQRITARIAELTAAFQLGEFATRRCGKLSTGQRQRTSIARAMIHDPAVLILDEPTNGLDILSSQFILQILRAERTRGKAVLFSTHILSEAELLCDRIGLLHRGRLLFEGSVAEILHHYECPSLPLAMLKAIAAVDPEAKALIETQPKSLPEPHL